MTVIATAVAALCQASTGLSAENTLQVLPTVEIVGTTPLPGIGLPIDKVPANVQTVKGKALE